MHGVDTTPRPREGRDADGITSSSNVTISDSIIETADDAIVSKAIARDGEAAGRWRTYRHRPRSTSSSTALTIGTETQADIRHVPFNNCVIRNSNRYSGSTSRTARCQRCDRDHLTVETASATGIGGAARSCASWCRKHGPRHRSRCHPRHHRDRRDRPGARDKYHRRAPGAPDRDRTGCRISTSPCCRRRCADKCADDALFIESARGVEAAISRRDGRGGPSRNGGAVGAAEGSDFDVDAFKVRQGLPSSNAAPILVEDVDRGAIETVRRPRKPTPGSCSRCRGR